MPVLNDRVAIGHLLKAARISKGLTQKELAKKMNVSEAYISKYENGERQPKISTLNKFLIALGVSLDTLSGYENGYLLYSYLYESIDTDQLKEYFKVLGMNDEQIEINQKVFISLDRSIEAEENQKTLIDQISKSDLVELINTMWEKYMGTDSKQRISTALDKLNPEGQQVAAERVEELTQIPKYQKAAADPAGELPEREDQP